MEADNAVAQATAAPPADRHTVSTVEPGQFFNENYRALVKAVMVIRGASQAEAEEAVSQAMSTALPRWYKITHPMAYVLRAALNAYVEERTLLPRIRTRQVERRDYPPECADDPDLNDWEDRQWVHQMLSRLAPAQLEVMAAVVDELQPIEIAKLLGRSPEAVRRGLADARRRLKQLIKDEQIADSNSTLGREAR